MTDGRKRIARVLATLCITALSGSVLVASPSNAEPDIDHVQSKVDSLYHQAEQASERYNNAKLEMSHAQTRLKALQADLDRQQSRVEQIRTQVARAVVSQYQGDALSSTTQVLLSQDPDAFLNQLTAVSQYNDQQTQMMADFAVQAKQLEMRESAAKRELARIATTKQQLGKDKAEIDTKAAAAKDLLGRLKDRAAAASRSKERERAARAAAAAPAPSTAPAPSAAPAPAGNVPASGRAGAAVQYAMAQVGDAYVYGATGPSAFDCSGLTMMAWKQAGVNLPHSSSAQMSSGTPVSQSQLKPGDLVFYYHPVSHVGMYIGNGRIVHAANPNSGVTTAPVNSMPYSGAVRPG